MGNMKVVVEKNRSQGILKDEYVPDLDEIFELADCEMETLKKAAELRNIGYDAAKRIYSRKELRYYVLVREGYNRAELRKLGIAAQAVTSFDDVAIQAATLLPVETPFGTGIRKWQLPFDMMPLRVFQTVFPPNTHVSSHTHPPHSDEAPGGGLRIISRGSIVYKGRRFGPGDWFFAPNGEPYEFVSDPDVETVVFYKYDFFAIEKGNRFSHPYAAKPEG
jgi:hypothetical protein